MKDGKDLYRDILTKGAGQVINYFSHQFLIAARSAAKAAAEAEANIAEYDPMTPAHALYGHIVTTIVLSVTGLEAWINELYWDCMNAGPEHVNGLAEEHRSRLGRLWSSRDLGLERRSIIEKYVVALELGMDKPADVLRGSVEYADAKALVELRNVLIHFKPILTEFDGAVSPDRAEWSRLERVLGGRFPENPHASGMPFFPYRCISAGCASWSINAVSRFHGRFLTIAGFNRAGISAVIKWGKKQ